MNKRWSVSTISAAVIDGEVETIAPKVSDVTRFNGFASVTPIQ